MGATTPLGLPQYSVGCGPPQEPAAPVRGIRRRRCLLKGCEQFYRPVHPQSRYCGESCRREARRWRCHRASRTWRSSPAGRRCRREQSRRGRRRIPLPLLTERPESPESPVSEAGAAASPPPAESREGQRPEANRADCSVRWCRRPGCYGTFAVASAWSPQRFCSCGCRRAFRNVLDREERYRRRRRGGYRPPPRRWRPAWSRPP